MGAVTGGGLVPKVPAPVGVAMGAIVEEGAVVLVVDAVVALPGCPVGAFAVGLGELPQALAASATLAVTTRAEIRVPRMSPVLSWWGSQVTPEPRSRGVTGTGLGNGEGPGQAGERKRA